MNMSNPDTIRDLIDRILGTMESEHYAPTVLPLYRAFYRQLVQYADERGIGVYSEALGHEFFRWRYHCTVEEIPTPASRRLSGPGRYLTVLNYYHLHDTFPPRRRLALSVEGLPTDYEQALDDFRTDCDTRGQSQRAARTRQYRVRHFLNYLVRQNVSLRAITGAILSEYIGTLGSYQPKTVRVMLSAIRSFLGFLYASGRHHEDLRHGLPPMRLAPSPRVGRSWSTEAISALVSAVDRSTAKGRRDYAILLLAARLGIRVGDIVTMPLTALHWQQRTIGWTQMKTGRAVELPLLGEVGWALIDYLRHGRPPTAASTIFVRHRAPFAPFSPDSNLHALLMSYARQAHLDIPASAHGMHALRHGLAQQLLSESTPIPIIADILGHHGMQSTQAYLAVDDVGLRQCALNPEEVFSDVRA